MSNGSRVLETEVRQRALAHGPFALIRQLEAAYIRDERDLYADRINFGERAVFTEEFKQAAKLKAVLDTFTASVAAAELVAFASANKDFSVLGTNMTSALSTQDTGGGNLLTTAGADADSAILLPQLSTIQTSWSTMPWKTSRRVHWHCLVTPRSATIAASTIWAGLKKTNTPVIATDDDQAFFRFNDVVGANWGFQSSVAGTDATIVDTGVVVVKDQTYLLSLIVDENRVCKAYIDGVLVATTGILTDLTLIPYVGVLAAGAAAAKAVTVRKLCMSQDYA